MCNLVEVDEVEPVGAMPRLRDLLDSCCAKRSEILENVSEVVGLAVELVDGAVAASLSGPDSVVDPRADELQGQLESTMVANVPLTANLSNPGDGRR